MEKETATGAVKGTVKDAGKGRYAWGSAIPELGLKAERGVEVAVDAIVTGVRPITQAIYEPTALTESYLLGEISGEVGGEVGGETTDVPSVLPFRSTARSERRALHERKQSQKRFKKAKHAYGRSWYLSSAQLKLLVVIWTGSCLLVSSAITLLWLALIERLGLN